MSTDLPSTIKDEEVIDTIVENVKADEVPDEIKKRYENRFDYQEALKKKIQQSKPVPPEEHLRCGTRIKLGSIVYKVVKIRQDKKVILKPLTLRV